jgi:hypothetical protein
MMSGTAASSPIMNQRAEPAVDDTSTPTFERVLATFENHPSGKPFEPSHVLVLMRLQRAARQHYAKMLDAALAGEDAAAALPLSAVLGAQMLHRRIANALAQVVLRQIPRPQLVEGQAQMAEIALCSLRARADEIKWHSFEHTRMQGASWQRAGEVLRAIESIGMECTLLEGTTTCADAFAHCMLIDSLNVGILSAPQMELAHRWLTASARDQHIEPYFDSEAHGYQIQLGEPRGPERITPSTQLSDSRRFLAVTPLGASLATARSQLYAGKLFPGASRSRTAALHFSAFLDLAERLWSADWRRASWRAERESALGASVQVVVGFEHVLGALREDADGTAQRPPEIHEWPLHDRSMTGLGFRLPLEASPEAPLGGLIAFRSSSDEAWELGCIVRRIRGAEEKTWVVGVRCLSDEPVIIDLGSAADSDGIERDSRVGAGAATAAIYAPINVDAGRVDGLIISTASFGAASDYLLPTRGSAFHIRANRVIDRGDDWVRIGFEVLGKQ